MLKFPGMRPTAEVVAILNKSPRRQQVVGILKQEYTGDALALIPADPRMPRMMVDAASMPSDLRQQLQVCPAKDCCIACWLNDEDKSVCLLGDTVQYGLPSQRLLHVG